MSLKTAVTTVLSALTLFVAVTSTLAHATEGDTTAVGPDKPVARELAARSKVRVESIDDDEVKVLEGRVKSNSGFPRRTGVVAAGMGFAVLPLPVVKLEERPLRDQDRGFRVER